MKVLVVVAHPDDETLGCGGTIAKHTLSGDEVYCLILMEQLTSRGITEEQKDNSIRAAKVLGIKELFFDKFPDQQFDSVPFLNIVKSIEKVKEEVNPNTIYTHYEYDLNLDHRITFQACLTAFRPLPGVSVKEIYSLEVPSSTEWGSKTFTPNVFVDISETFDKKIEALKCYESELRKYPHPRSIEAIRVLAKYRGYQSGLEMAETFQLVRWIK